MSTNLLIKDTIFTVPSQGRLYEKELGLISGDSVKIRPFVASDQKVLAGQSGDPYRLYRNLLSKIIVEPKQFDVDKLLLSDANAILYAVRVMSYGPEYGISYKCSGCGTNNKIKCDMTELEVIEADDIKDFSLLRTVELDSGDIVKIRLSRLEDEKRTSSMIKRLKKKKDDFVDNEVEKSFVRLAVLIEEINDIESSEIYQNIEFINNLSFSDFDLLKETIEDNDSGIDTVLDYECSSCGWEQEVSAGVSAEFFRPKHSRSKKLTR